MNITSVARGVRLSPRKVSLVAGLVRGRSVADALIILEHTPKRAAAPVAKAIASAKANALTNHRADEKSLVIEQLQVTAGPRIRRFRPAAMGRALPYQKRSSHIRVILSATEKPKKSTATAKETETKPVAQQTKQKEA